MKKLLIITALLISSTSMIFAAEVDRLSKDEVKNMSEDQRIERVEVLEARLMEIQAMDLSDMEKADKKETKKEIKYIQKELKAHANGGIYISTGAVILILLIILIL